MTRSWLWYRPDLFESSEQGSQQLLGDWGCGNWVFRLTVPSLWISIRAQFSDQRWSPSTPIMIHNLHLEVNQICHGHKQTKNRTEEDYNQWYSDQDLTPIMTPHPPPVPVVQSVVNGVKTQLISVIASRAVDDAEPFCSNYSVCTFHGSPPSCLWLVSSCQPRPLIGCSVSPCAAPARQECPISSSPSPPLPRLQFWDPATKNILRDAPQIRLSGVIQPAPRLWSKYQSK